MSDIINQLRADAAEMTAKAHRITELVNKKKYLEEDLYALENQQDEINVGSVYLYMPTKVNEHVSTYRGKERIDRHEWRPSRTVTLKDPETLTRQLIQTYTVECRASLAQVNAELEDLLTV